MERYLAYIRNLDMTYTKAYGNCKEVCEGMKKRFPELRLVRGHYYCAVWSKRGHWWLETESGERIDPTAMQFPSKGKGVYEEWDDSQPEPTGMCPNCGELCYNGEYVHEHCYNAFVASLM